MDWLTATLVSVSLSGLVVGLLLIRLHLGRRSAAAADAFANHPASGDIINISRIRVAGIGGLGLVAMALVVAWAVPSIGQILAVCLAVGAIVGIALIRWKR